MVPEESTTLVLLMVLGYLKQGYLSRSEGGTARFRDALIDTYRRSGGGAILHSTVDEVLVEGNRARGVRLGDGTVVDGDLIVSTASAPETVLRLLGGRYGAAEMRQRMGQWKMFRPVVLASYGVATPLARVPSTLLIDYVDPITVGEL